MVTSQEQETRQFGRYNVSHEVTLVFGNANTPARITNESIGGARLEFSAPVNFAMGSKIIIRQGDTESEGYVRNLGCLEGEDGMFAGISWDPPENPNEESITANFLRYGKLDVVCRSRDDQEDGTSQITLWDGAVFIAEQSALVVCSRDARAASLAKPESQISTLAKLYGVAGQGQEIVQRVLDFEFSS